MTFLDKAAIFSSNSFSFLKLDSESWKSLFSSVSASNVLCLFQSCLNICHHKLTAVDLLDFLKQMTDWTAHLMMNIYLQSCMQWVSLQRKQLKDLHWEEQSLSWLNAHLKLYLVSHWLWWSHSHSSSLCDLTHRIISVLSWTSFSWRSAMSLSTVMCCESISLQVMQYFFSSLWRWFFCQAWSDKFRSY